MGKQGLIIIMVLMLAASCAPKLNTVALLPQTYMKYQFPLDWLGTYEGPLIISASATKTDTAMMRLQITSPDAQGYYPWIISYGDEAPRYYGLEAINTTAGHYVIDEFNSIKVSGFTKENHFICRFNVMGSDLLVDYQREAEGIRVRFYISSINSITTTGGEVFGQDTIPQVKAFPIMVYQEALLKKVEQSTKDKNN